MSSNKDSSESQYKYGMKEILIKMAELANMVDQSRFTKLIIDLNSGYKVSVSNKKRHELFIQTHKVERSIHD